MAQAAKAAPARKAASKIAQTIRAARTDSTVADLSGKATTASATAGAATELRTGPNFTGQYLYDRFIGDKEAAAMDVSRMDVVRQMTKALDVQSFKTAIADMVTVAKGYRDNAIKAAKDAGNYDEQDPPVAVRAAKGNYKTAQNYQTRMRVAYGAIRFAPDELAAVGGDEHIGFHLMYELGTKALDTKGINWDGTKAESPESKQARRDQREETEAMLEVQDAHPRKTGESRADYFGRIDKLVEKRLAERAEERHTAEVKALVAKVRKTVPPDLLDEVLEAIIEGEEPGDDAPAPAKTDLH